MIIFCPEVHQLLPSLSSPLPLASLSVTVLGESVQRGSDAWGLLDEGNCSTTSESRLWDQQSSLSKAGTRTTWTKVLDNLRGWKRCSWFSYLPVLFSLQPLCVVPDYFCWELWESKWRWFSSHREIYTATEGAGLIHCHVWVYLCTAKSIYSTLMLERLRKTPTHLQWTQTGRKPCWVWGYCWWWCCCGEEPKGLSSNLNVWDRIFSQCSRSAGGKLFFLRSSGSQERQTGFHHGQVKAVCLWVVALGLTLRANLEW